MSRSNEREPRGSASAKERARPKTPRGGDERKYGTKCSPSCPPLLFMGSLRVVFQPQLPKCILVGGGGGYKLPRNNSQREQDN